MPTLESLKAAGARVWWKCQQCETSGDVDVDRVIAAKGPDYDLTDRTAPCRAEGCTYWVNFYAQAGMRNTPLRTEAGMLREMNRRSAWLAAGWASEARADQTKKGPASFPARPLDMLIRIGQSAGVKSR